jgi:putative endonuclease
MWQREKGRREIGKRGEDAAAQYLRRKGYKIVERNFRCTLGEIDIIAFEGDTLCFIEVKTVSGKNYGPPEIAVDINKQRKLSRVALAFLGQNGLHDTKARFDVVAITLSSGEERVDLLKDAFELAFPGFP